MEEEEKMDVVDINVETHLYLSNDKRNIPDDAFIEKAIRESFKEIIKQNLKSQLIKVKSGEYENLVVGCIGRVLTIASSGVRLINYYLTNSIVGKNRNDER